MTAYPVIRKIDRADSSDAIWELCQELREDGTTYVFLPDTSRTELLDYWFPSPGETYLAMQFNLVVATNAGAIALWESLGFTRIATLPKAFDHAELGLTDAIIMHRSL